MKEAIEQYDSAIRKFAPYREVFISYGNMLYRHRRFKEAIEQYRNAEAADPENPEIKFRMGLLYLESGSYEEAVGKLERVLERLPAHFGQNITPPSPTLSSNGILNQGSFSIQYPRALIFT